jgi:hypothetical protein
MFNVKITVSKLITIYKLELAIMTFKIYICVGIIEAAELNELNGRHWRNRNLTLMALILKSVLLIDVALPLEAHDVFSLLSRSLHELKAAGFSVNGGMRGYPSFVYFQTTPYFLGIFL